MNTKKRSLIGGEIIKIHEDKKSKQENVKVVQKNMYGDGVTWFRGEIIGKGSFGCVFLANSKKPKSKHSSYYPPIMAVKSAEVSGSGSIQKEKEVMDNIRGSCPNVIKCFGEEITNGENGQMVYNLLLEYGSGGTLADLIKKSGGNGLPELDVRRYTRSIVRGLSHIHNRGYVHCDLKPDNVLLVSGFKDGFFDAKIGDFGLAKRVNKNHKNKNKKLGVYNWRGTPMYLSPEAVMYGVQEPPADIWAVGCIVSEMLTGKPLWLTGKPLWFSKQDSCVDEVLSRMKISKEGKSFLKGCLCRKIMCRLSADMLLDHPFLKGLIEDDANEVKESNQEVFDINTITSSLMFSDDDDDDEMWLSSYSDGSCYSDVDAMEDEESRDSRFLELQQYSVTLTISKGV